MPFNVSGGKVNPQHLLKGKSIQHLAGTGKPRRAPPAGYQCKACGAAGDNRHWIYECPKKKSKRESGLNNQDAVKHSIVNQRKLQEQRERKRRKLDPDANPNKIFVSGLPFGVTQEAVADMFESCGTLSKIQLLYFPGRSKCKGQCFVTFTTSAAATFAVDRINGKTMEGEDGKSRYLEVVHSRSRTLNPTSINNNNNNNNSSNDSKTKEMKTEKEDTEKVISSSTTTSSSNNSSSSEDEKVDDT